MKLAIKDIPPLDVLLVWHAFLQDPVAWGDFIEDSQLLFSRWNPDELVCITNSSGAQEFSN
ncbi:hypothetical protein FVEG_03949 [Fusarium verticillioides 7600]|uniref:Uncharacterized protein n=1 Tax=Gibberella moniliformis (strain M3125 / FGSC 7600) TaxID=334819 RepID=W7M386_GIBM7|nr:hypothetical protein FVEG_03949 [Fusarium verticillioides 7600]EWG41979.1 hypothetical protein FVEG_03949 [Fusarium verticillioides 7600]